eukprot:s6368_g3.t1
MVSVAEPGFSPEGQQSFAEGTTEDSSRPRSPLNIRELFQWPQRVAAALDPAELCRLRSILLSDVVVFSDYSGYGSEREALTCVLRAICQRHGWHLERDPFIYARSCDIGQLPQQVLQALAESSDVKSRPCLFADVVEHCAPQAVSWLRAAVPADDCSMDEAVKAYNTIMEWLLANRSWVFPLDGKQACLIHKKACPVCPMAGWAARVQHLQDLQGAQKRKHDEAFLHETEAAAVEEGAGSSNLATTVSAEACESAAEGNGEHLAFDRPLSVCFAGVSCDGWSVMGSQKRFAHHSELPHNVFVAERVARAEQGIEDVCFVECTAKYPCEQKLSQPMAGSHHVLHFRCNPLSFGFPVSRPRVFAACLNLRSVVWVGPNDWEQDFANKFYSSCAVSGDALLVSTPEERASVYREMAQLQKNYVAPKTSWDSLSPADLLAATLPPGQQQRAGKYLDCRHRMEGSCGSFLFDVDHHVEMRNMGGPYWPCLLTHGCVVSAPRQGRIRIATPSEHFAAQGLHILPGACQDNPASPLAPILLSLKGHQMKQLSGRGVHLAVLSAWMMYILSNIVPRSKAITFCRLGTWDTPAQGTDSDAAEDDEIEDVACPLPFAWGPAD